MIICNVEKKELEDLTPTSIVPQTPFWGRVKKNQGYIPTGFEINASADLLFENRKSTEKVSDDLLVLIKRIDRYHCYAYIPYGPEIEPDFENQGLFLEHLSETLRSHLPQGCIFIRYDLMWQNQWAADEEYFDQSGNWLGPPQNHVQEFRINYKTATWNLRKSDSDILPKNTFFLDLTQQEKDLLKNMRYNTRYNINRAIRNGINVREYGPEHIGEWYKLYLDTATRHHLPLQSQDYFMNVLKNQDNDKKGVNVKMLMADLDGQFLASMFLVLSKNRGTYLYGASSSDNKDMMASYALQWESIRISKNRGCSEYDMFGSAPDSRKQHPLHGIHIYKKGFGGKLYHRMGCWDYPCDQELYNLFKLQEQQLLEKTRA